MKPLLFILSLFLTLTAFGQADSGFTNKAEAENLYTHGILQTKVGKWMEYYRNDGDTTQPFYRLAVYYGGMLTGIVRYYYSDGVMYRQEFYRNGMKNGIVKEYDYKKMVIKEIPYTDDTINGLVKTYYESGKLFGEKKYIKGKLEYE